jgi:hypothetical protein
MCIALQTLSSTETDTDLLLAQYILTAAFISTKGSAAVVPVNISMKEVSLNFCWNVLEYGN